MKKIVFTSIFVIFVCVFAAHAAIKVKNNTAERFAVQTGAVESVEQAQDFDDASAIATLEEDIRILDEEIAKCEKQKKGWIAATVIGGVGVLSTGVAAAVQGAKLKEQKDTISGQKDQIDALKKQNNALGK